MATATSRSSETVDQADRLSRVIGLALDLSDRARRSRCIGISGRGGRGRG